MALEEMRGGDESARPQLEQAEKNFTNMLSDVDKKLETLFTEYDQSRSHDKLVEVRGILNRRKYIQNLLNEVHKELTPTAHRLPPTTHHP
jgi:hypothetical protein